MERASGRAPDSAAGKTARSRRSRAALFAMALLVATGPAGAQSQVAVNAPPTADLAELSRIEAEREVLFRRMLVDPADLDLAFRYAALSAQAGDLEGAIATLERMLIFAPGLPRLQLELGVLYFRLGAYETASGYFESALAAPDVPPEVRQRVLPFQETIAARTAPSRFEAAVIAGARYQSNANAAPESRTVRLNGLDFLLSDASTSASDVNGFLAGSLRYSLDLQTQGDTLDIGLQGYGALYADRTELNTALAELTVGPRFNLQRFRIDGASLGVYAILGGVHLDGDPYLLSAGAGANLTKTIGSDTLASLTFEYRNEAFRNSFRRPTASTRTGDRFSGRASLEKRLTARTSIFGTVSGERRDANEGFFSLNEGGLSLGTTHLFEGPFGARDRPWSTTLSGGLLRRAYDDPDPLINARQAQNDDEVFLQGSLTVPLRDDWAVQTVLGYRDVSSNYDIRDFSNVSATLGLMKRF